MIEFEIQNQKPLNEIVYDELKNQILTGKIKPGIRLMEKEIIKDAGVSRTPVREAIRKLEEAGLIIIEPRKATYVSSISKKILVEMLEVRQNMEELAATLACERITDIEKEKLKGIKEFYEAATERQDINGMIKYDTEFHQIIIEASKNKILMLMLTQMKETILRFRYMYYNNYKLSEKVVEEHNKIYMAITKNDVENAKKETKKHISKLIVLILSGLTETRDF